MHIGLARAGGVRIPNGVRLHGWDITVTTAPISGMLLLCAVLLVCTAPCYTHMAHTGEADLGALKSTLGHDVLALPEQLFGGSSVVLSHTATNTILRFDARGALQGVQTCLCMVENGAHRWYVHIYPHLSFLSCTSSNKNHSLCTAQSLCITTHHTQHGMRQNSHPLRYLYHKHGSRHVNVN